MRWLISHLIQPLNHPIKYDNNHSFNYNFFSNFDYNFQLNLSLAQLSSSLLFILASLAVYQERSEKIICSVFLPRAIKTIKFLWFHWKYGLSCIVWQQGRETNFYKGSTKKMWYLGFWLNRVLPLQGGISFGSAAAPLTENFRNWTQNIGRISHVFVTFCIGIRKSFLLGRNKSFQEQYPKKANRNLFRIWGY